MTQKDFLAVIPARGGSKGILRKNIRNLGGKPLLAWTIEAAKKSRYINRLILSSEDEEIIKVAKKYACEVPFNRPQALAEDTTPGVDPILHAIDQCPEYKNVIVLQPTSPLRTVEDIDGCIELFMRNQSSACVSVTKPNHSPFWMYQVNDNNLIKPLIEENIYNSRQQLPPVYALNGAIYIANSDWLKLTKNFLSDETIGYIMPSTRSIDIDTEDDMKLAEYYINNWKGN